MDNFISDLFAHIAYIGKGMQTWEYSPDYAIRSYSYVYSLFKLLQLLINIFPSIEKVNLFSIARIILGVACAYAEPRQNLY